MSRLIYKGETYESGSSLARALGESPTRVNNILIGREGDVTEIVDTSLKAYKENKRQLGELNKLLNQEYTNLSKARLGYSEVYNANFTSLLKDFNFDEIIELTKLTIKN